jgi:Zn-dependent peptidase ImmA (M78 family)
MSTGEGTPAAMGTQALHQGNPESDFAMKHEAEKAAWDLLTTTWGAQPETGECALPVDPFHIAARLGLRVFFSRLNPDVSGMLAKRPHQDAEVYINDADSGNRQRFSCAHEIGHYVKRGSSSEAESWGYIDRRGPSAARGDNPEEIYANQFAAALLMPEPKVRQLASQFGAAAMAVRFGVSLEAMKFRLENLGISYWA